MSNQGPEPVDPNPGAPGIYHRVVPTALRRAGAVRGVDAADDVEVLLQEQPA